MKIVLINGAPRSGKDSAGNMIAAATPGRWAVSKFSKSMKERCHAAYHILGPDGTPAAHDYFENCKDEPSTYFMGATPREAYIAFSEKFMKPLHGEDIFGYSLIIELEAMNNKPDGMLITDSGFYKEAAVLVDHFGPEDMTLIRLHRVGYTFENDSRNLVNLSCLGVRTHDVNSPDGDLPGLLKNIQKSVPYLFRGNNGDN